MPASHVLRVRGLRASVFRTSPPALFPLIVVILAFALRVYRLGYQELRGDETFGYFFSLQPPAGLIEATLALREPHPVGSYIIQQAWVSIAGHTEFALRFVSAWFGAIAVALLYRLARSLGFARPVAALASLLLACSPYAVWHSQDARMYSISLALTIAVTWLLVAGLQPGSRRWAWPAYVVVAWLALHVHYFAVFVLLAHNIWMVGLAALGRRPYRGLLVRWLVHQLALAVLYLPWLIAAGGIIGGYGGNGDSPSFGAMLGRSLSVFAVGETLPAGQRLLPALAALALLVIGALRLYRSGTAGRDHLALLLLYLAVPLLASWAAALGRPIFNERYLIAAAPPFFLLMAAAVPAASPARRLNAFARSLFVDGRAPVLLGLGLLFAFSVLSLSHLYADPAFSKSRGWRELAGALRSLSAGLPRGEVRVMQNYPDPTLWYYLPEQVERLALPPAAHDAAGAAHVVAEQEAAGVRYIFIPLQPSPVWDEDGLATAALEQRYRKIMSLPVGSWSVEAYVRPPAALPGPVAAFTGGLVLQGAAVEPSLLAPGGLVVVHLSWSGSTDALAPGEQITLQLLDESGRLTAQHDETLVPPDARFVPPLAPRTYGLALPRALPSGTHRLILALYNASPAAEVRLRATREPGTGRLLTVSGKNAVELAQLEVR